MTADAAVLAAARAQFDPEPGWAFLDAATYGLPPRDALAQLERATAEWRGGGADWDAWEQRADMARGLFAGLAGVPVATVALLGSTSVGVGLVAASLPANAQVVVPDDEYASVLLPMLAGRARGIEVRQVPFHEIAGAIRPGTTLAAVSSIQLHTGRAADLAAILNAAEAADTQVLVDASQGMPFHELGAEAQRIDYLVCAGYKHLLGPHGTTFLAIRADRRDALVPWHANWRAVDAARGGAYLGGPQPLLDTSARFDTSLALLPWIGQAESLKLLDTWLRAGLADVVRGHALRIAAAFGLPAPASSLVCVPVRDDAAAIAALRAARVRAALRSGSVRFSPHAWTTAADVERAIAAIGPMAIARSTAS